MAVTLDFLGEAIRQLQAEMRTLRSEVAAMRAERDSERNDILQAMGGLLRASEVRVMDRLASFEAHIDTRVDRVERDVGATRDELRATRDDLQASVERLGTEISRGRER